jgi:hypothetical protein
MKARRVGPVVACLLLHVAWAYAGANDEADGVVRANQRAVIQVTGGSLTVSVDRSPLSIVLAVIAHQSGVSIRYPASIAEEVTANLRDIALDEGLTRIIGARSAVFVYSDNAAAGRHPKLVEVRVYEDQAPRSGSPATPSADRPWPAEPAENVASLDDAPGTLARSWSSSEDHPVRRLARAVSEEHDPSARARAAIALGTIGGGEAIAHLAAAIATDPATAVREAAATALGRTWSEHAIAPLIQALLEDPGFFVREAAAHALGDLWSETAVEALAQAVSVDPRHSVREAAAEALGKIGGPGTWEVLAGALGDAHSTVRESAAAALGAIGRPDALGALNETARTDPDPWVRQNAEVAVAKLKGDETSRRHHHRRRHRTATDMDRTGTDVK